MGEWIANSVGIVQILNVLVPTILIGLIALIRREVRTVAKEQKSNGGSTQRDAVDRTENGVAQIAEDLKTMGQEHREFREYVRGELRDFRADINGLGQRVTKDSDRAVDAVAKVYERLNGHIDHHPKG